MVEHRTPNPRAGGSNPSWPATQCHYDCIGPGYLNRYDYGSKMATNKSLKSTKKAKQVEKLAEPRSKFEISRISEFSQEVKNEFHKIAWPDKKHTMATTGVVVVLVFLVSFYLGTVDLLLGKLIGMVIK